MEKQLITNTKKNWKKKIDSKNQSQIAACEQKSQSRQPTFLQKSFSYSTFKLEWKKFLRGTTWFFAPLIFSAWQKNISDLTLKSMNIYEQIFKKHPEELRNRLEASRFHKQHRNCIQKHCLLSYNIFFLTRFELKDLAMNYTCPNEPDLSIPIWRHFSAIMDVRPFCGSWQQQLLLCNQSLSKMRLESEITQLKQQRVESLGCMGKIILNKVWRPCHCWWKY